MVTGTLKPKSQAEADGLLALQKEIEGNYLKNETAHRNETVENYVDESYEWEGGF